MNAEEDAIIECPYCGEPFAISVPTTEGDEEFVEDCAVCCRPMTVLARCRPGCIVSLQVERA